MFWICCLLVTALTTFLGLMLSGYVANSCVAWYRISSFEGKSGYFVIGVALLGAGVGLMLGPIIVSGLAPQTAADAVSTAVVATFVELVFAAIFYFTCWSLADIPPRIGGSKLRLDIEVMLPRGSQHPHQNDDGDNQLVMHSVVFGKARESEIGQLLAHQARQEDGRWIIPGSVELFTQRGMRSISVRVHGQDIMGYMVPLPRSPTVKHLEWSLWAPRTRPPAAPWPDSQPSYRFRVQQIGDELDLG